MRNILKIAHFFGAAGFVGSVALYVALGMTMDHSRFPDAVFATRRMIAFGTSHVTIPALFVAVISGFWLYARLPPRSATGWVRFKALAGLLVLANTIFIVEPAVTNASRAAEAAASTGILGVAYQTAVLRESLCGTLNIVLILALVVIAVWRPGQARRQAMKVTAYSR